MLTIFLKYPKLKNIPHIALGDFPTPIIEKNILKNNKLWIKCDNLSNKKYGGNKVRKLEFSLAQVIKKNKTRIITGGGIGSNMTVAVSLFAKEYNIKINSILFKQPINDYVKKNLILTKSLSDNCIISDNYIFFVKNFIKEIIKFSIKDKEIPYILLPGDSNSISNLGYLNAFFEIENQFFEIKEKFPDYIFVAGGSGGTLAGLLCGLILSDKTSKIVASCVSDKIIMNYFNIENLVEKTFRLLNKYGIYTPKFKIKDFLHIDLYSLGKGYGYCTDKSISAFNFAKDNGIILDPCYTSKSFATLLEYDRKFKNKTFLFVNTFSSKSNLQII
jgi:D-cysteine desulfhydrase